MQGRMLLLSRSKMSSSYSCSSEALSGKALFIFLVRTVRREPKIPSKLCFKG